MADMMMFPVTVEEFMEQYKIVDREQVYTNGAELIPIFRMEQWFAHKRGRWEVVDYEEPRRYGCSECKRLVWHTENYCPNCGARMESE